MNLLTKLPRLQLSCESLILLATAYLLCFANHSFWQRMQVGLGPFGEAWATYLAAALLLFSLLSILLALLTPRVAIKPVLAVLFVIAAGAAYFMDKYGAIIDRHALQSAFESDARESAEWLSTGMIWPFIKVALLPILAMVFLLDVKPRDWKKGTLYRGALVAAAISCSALMIGLNYQAFASLARNHTPLRDLFNPLNVMNATRAYIKKSGRKLPDVMQPVAADIKRGNSWLSEPDKTKPPTLLVFVVGESVRASSFSLITGDTARDTTPELRQLPITLMRDVHSCGTNTATSVPCMFSNLTREHYDEWQANSQDNLLDVLMRAGFSVEWVDNNTGSKNVARRALEIDVAHRTDPKYCNADGCHDEMLVDELKQRLPKIAQSGKDSVLVLHQLGSHGPAYFQRYPERFARFQPICKSVELQDCDSAAVRNSYDNTVLYTDYVLAQLIKTLQAEPSVESLLFYVSDHGESTGENGLYLHGAPYAFAPDEQIKVPMFWWFSEAFQQRRKLSNTCLEQAGSKASSHDAVFHMTLKMLDLTTSAYQAKLNPFDGCG